ncbi:MAG: hypothetical protein HWE10_06000 [Gammaproteobacteria bacterium]|nr:hypothetical protein [Gammaproteobacteria bacterium]
MPSFFERDKLPDNPTMKDINLYKKKINWGEIPTFFHLIANAVAEAEGFVTYGFDNAYTKIIDRKNWNYDNLGIPDEVDVNSVDHIEQIEPVRKPRICLYHIFNVNGYELIALPYVRNTVIDEYRKYDENMDFKIWDPSQMKSLVRITQFHKFIAMNIKSGDDADMALIKHAHNVVNNIIEHLKQNVQVEKIKGMTIKDAYNVQYENPEQSPVEVIRSQMNQDDLTD